MKDKMRLRQRPQGRHGPIKHVFGDLPTMSFNEAEMLALDREREEFLAEHKKASRADDPDTRHKS